MWWFLDPKTILESSSSCLCRWRRCCRRRRRRRRRRRLVLQAELLTANNKSVQTTGRLSRSNFSKKLHFNFFSSAVQDRHCNKALGKLYSRTSDTVNGTVYAIMNYLLTSFIYFSFKIRRVCLFCLGCKEKLNSSLKHLGMLSQGTQHVHRAIITSRCGESKSRIEARNN